jgi:hypothetical protein
MNRAMGRDNQASALDPKREIDKPAIRLSMTLAMTYVGSRQ